MGPRLKPDEYLNIAALSRLFESTSSSYKFLFFRSLMDLLSFEDENPDFDGKIPLDRLLKGIVINAWYPYSEFDLKFGEKSDLIVYLERLKKRQHGFEVVAERLHTEVNKKNLYDLGFDENVIKSLGVYVPYLLLIPFFDGELRGVRHPQTIIPRLANERYLSLERPLPLYQFDSNEYRNCKNIILDESWIEYLRIHRPVIEAWHAWHWFLYMQKRNPFTPELHSKLFPPLVRENLGKQRKYWKKIIEGLGQSDTAVRCIYSGREILVPEMSLDHYFPWSYMGHNQLWNLIPTIREINSQKSNRLPDDRYLEKFVAVQINGLDFYRRRFPTEFSDHFYTFGENLGMTADSFSPEAIPVFKQSYTKLLRDWMVRAQLYGLESGWQYRE